MAFLFLTILSALTGLFTLSGIQARELDVTRESLILGFVIEAALIGNITSVTDWHTSELLTNQSYKCSKWSIFHSERRARTFSCWAVSITIRLVVIRFLVVHFLYYLYIYISIYLSIYLSIYRFFHSLSNSIIDILWFYSECGWDTIHIHATALVGWAQAHSVAVLESQRPQDNGFLLARVPFSSLLRLLLRYFSTSHLFNYLQCGQTKW